MHMCEVKEMDETRCHRCGVDFSYIRQGDNAHVCRKCGNVWPVTENEDVSNEGVPG